MATTMGAVEVYENGPTEPRMDMALVLQARIVEKMLQAKLAKQARRRNRDSSSIRFVHGGEHIHSLQRSAGEQEYTSEFESDGEDSEDCTSCVSESDVTIYINSDSAASSPRSHVESSVHHPASNSTAQEKSRDRFCCVCFETMNSEADWFSCAGCNTACCPTCLEQYLQRATGEGRPLTCLGFSTNGRSPCPEDIPTALALSLLGSERMAAHAKHVRMKADRDLRECPSCGTLQGGNGSQPDMTCSHCGTEFCFFHDLQHRGKKCSKRAGKGGGGGKGGKGARVRSSLYKVLFTTRCPQCHVSVQRSSGCPHITCALCKTHFCYHCGKATPTGIYEHRQVSQLYAKPHTRNRIPSTTRTDKMVSCVCFSACI